MNEQKQSEGREKNAASPVEDWEASGVLHRKQEEDVERTGRTDQVAGERKTFRDVGGGQHQNVDEQKMMQEGGMLDADNLQGPAGDPAEGKRRDSTYPS